MSSKYYCEEEYDAHPLHDEFLNITSGGFFCSGGPVNLPTPGLSVEGVGLVSFPLIDGPFQAIKDAYKPRKDAGRAANQSNRNVFCIDPSQATITNPKWDEALRDLATFCAEQLGAHADRAEAVLCRLELHDTGGASRTESDAALGAFATLIVQFPRSE